MAELFDAIASWRSLLLVLVVFGFAPGFVLRLLVRIYPKGDPRRTELIAQLYVLRRLERPLFVAEQLETVLFEGMPHRFEDMWHLVRAVIRVIWRTERQSLNEGQSLDEKVARMQAVTNTRMIGIGIGQQEISTPPFSDGDSATQDDTNRDVDDTR
jgi:hypothetical protein